jgi:hypothetical protein
MNNIVPVFGILGVFFVPAAVIVLWLWLRHRNYSRRQETIRAAIEKGMDPNVVAELDRPPDHRLIGLVWLLAGLGAIPGLGFTAGWHIALYALIPVGIGIAYLAAWALGRDEPSPAQGI